MFTDFSGNTDIYRSHTVFETSLVWADLELINCLLFFVMDAGRLSAQSHGFMISFQQKRLFLLFT